MKKLNQSGSHIVAVLVIIVVVAVVGLVGWRVMSNGKSKNNSSTASTPTTQKTSNNSQQYSGRIGWGFTGTDWKYMISGNPPACVSPLKLTNSPADVSLVTAILYPGQTRGGNYKPHGGFRFDNTKDNKVTVKAPIDAQIFRGARYLVSGETQYTFDFIAPCGIMYRVGHLLTLTPDFQKIADTFPAAQEGDSRTTNISPQTTIKAGTVIGTAVGTTKGGVNTFFDFGVYDLRSQNAVSKTVAYQQAHSDDMELSWHAVCWFSLLPGNDAAKVKSLPAGDPTSGKHSDYCDVSGNNITTPSGALAPTTSTTASGQGSGSGTGGGSGNGTGGGSGSH